MRRRTLMLVAMSLFLAMAGFGIIIPALPFYTSHLQGHGPLVGLTVGLLMASYSLVQFVCAPIWGHISDRIGRRPVFLVGLAGFALSFLLMGLAQNLFWLFASRIVGGLLSAALIPTAMAMVSDLTSTSDRGKGMGLAGAAMGMGFVFGPAIGGILAQGDDFRLPFFAAAGVAALTLLVSAFTIHESREEQAASDTPRPGFFGNLKLHGTTLWAWLVLTFLQTLMFSSMEATLALYSRDTFGLKTRDVGYLMALMGLVGAIVAGGIIGRLIKRHGEPFTLKLGFGLFAVGFAAVIITPSIPWFAVALAAVGAGSACMRPSLNSGVSKQAAGQSTGAALGLLQSCDSLSRVAGPVLGGSLYVAGHSLPFSVNAAIAVAALAFTFLALRQPVANHAPGTGSSLPVRGG